MLDKKTLGIWWIILGIIIGVTSFFIFRLNHNFTELSLPILFIIIGIILIIKGNKE